VVVVVAMVVVVVCVGGEGGRYGPGLKNGNSEGAAAAWPFDASGKIVFDGDALFGCVCEGW
jgi:hypothetical protein